MPSNLVSKTMPEIPNRVLSPSELKELKNQAKLEKIFNEIDQRNLKESELPAKIAGRLIAVFAVVFFLDLSGWMVAFVDGSVYARLTTLFQIIETLCVIGLAGFAIHGSIQAYRLEQEKKFAEEKFWAEINS